MASAAQFDFAIQDAPDIDETLDISEEVYELMLPERDDPLFFRQASTGQIALLMSVFGDGARGGGAMATIFEFLRTVMVDNGQRELRELLSDQGSWLYRVKVSPDSDELREPISVFLDIILKMVELMSGNPTQPSSGSSGSRGTTGKPSTASTRRPASTRSRSPRSAS